MNPFRVMKNIFPKRIILLFRYQTWRARKDTRPPPTSNNVEKDMSQAAHVSPPKAHTNGKKALAMKNEIIVSLDE